MMRTKEEKVHQVFENISTEYDRMNSLISFKLHFKWRKKTMLLMKVDPGKSALDVCCGTADWTIMMKEALGPSGKVEGLDFSAKMLSVGKQKVMKRGFHDIELICGNAMDLPFEDDSFDYITIGFGLRNVPDYQHVLGEIHRVLRPGGQFVCLDTSQPTIWGWKQLFNVYFRYIMPVFGKIFAKSYQEYSWLQESTRYFPNKQILAVMMQQAGFTNVKYISHSGGVSASHFGFKRKKC